MSLSNIQRAKVAEESPRLLAVKSIKAFRGNQEEELDPVTFLSEQLISLKQQIEREEQLLIQRKEEFEKQLLLEKERFDQMLEEERKRLLEQAFSEGFAKGEESGLEAWQEKLHQANNVIALSQKESEAYIDASESIILNLAFEIAEKIVSQTLDLKEEAWLSLLKEAVKEMREDSPIKVVVSPFRYEETVRQLDALQEVAFGSQLLVFNDDTLEPNDCRIESPSGLLDAGVNTQLVRLQHTLSELMGAS